jgi:hypothetical protein
MTPTAVTRDALTPAAASARNPASAPPSPRRCTNCDRVLPGLYVPGRVLCVCGAWAPAAPTPRAKRDTKTKGGTP